MISVIPAKAGIQGPGAMRPDVNAEMQIAYLPVPVGMRILNKSP